MTTHVMPSEPVAHTWWELHGRSVLVNLSRYGLLALFLATWELAAGRWIDPLFISRPSAIASQFHRWLLDGTLAHHTWETLQETIGGYALGAALGIIAAFCVAPSRMVEEVIDPFIFVLYSIPKIALAPLFIIWFGLGMQMKVIFVATLVFFLVYLQTLAGIKGIDRAIVDSVRLLNPSRWQLITTVILPGSVSGIILGLKIAVPYALTGAVVGELIAANRGIGYLVTDSASRFNTAGVFAALAVLTLGAWLLNMAVNFAGMRSSRWQRNESL